MGHLDFVATVQNVILHPEVGAFLPLALISFFNELIAVFPYVVLLAGQLFFLHDSLTLAMLAKLLVFVAVPVGIGGTLGVLPVYFLAYYGGKPLIDKYHKFFRFKWEDVERVNRYFRGHWHDEVIFLILRTVPVLPSFPLTIAAGVFRMRLMPYLVLTAVGMIVRMMITILIVGVGVESLSQIVSLIYTE